MLDLYICYGSDYLGSSVMCGCGVNNYFLRPYRWWIIFLRDYTRRLKSMGITVMSIIELLWPPFNVHNRGVDNIIMGVR